MSVSNNTRAVNPANKKLIDAAKELRRLIEERKGGTGAQPDEAAALAGAEAARLEYLAGELDAAARLASTGAQGTRPPATSCAGH